MSDNQTAEPPLSFRLFAKRAAMVAHLGSRWASSALEVENDLRAAFPEEAAERFAEEVQRLLEIIKRDSKPEGYPEQ